MSISRSASIMYRMGQVYFDKKLAPYDIGCGQQFILLRISEFDIVSQSELCVLAHYDKGTVARAVQKLVGKKFVERIIDDHDKRIVYLKITNKGMKLIPIIKDMIASWHQLLIAGLSDDEKVMCDRLMIKLSANAEAFALEHKRSDKYE